MRRPHGPAPSDALAREIGGGAPEGPEGRARPARASRARQTVTRRPCCGHDERTCDRRSEAEVVALIDEHDQTWSVSSNWPAFTRRFAPIARTWGVEPVVEGGTVFFRGLPFKALAGRKAPSAARRAQGRRLAAAKEA